MRPPSFNMPGAATFFRLDNLVVLGLVLVGIAWGVDLLGCRLGYAPGALDWMLGTLRPLTLGLAAILILVGVVQLALRRTGALWLVTGVVLTVLPEIFLNYAPAACTP